MADPAVALFGDTVRAAVQAVERAAAVEISALEETVTSLQTAEARAWEVADSLTRAVMDQDLIIAGKDEELFDRQCVPPYA